MPKNSLESQLHKSKASRSKNSLGTFKIEKNKEHVSPSISEISKNPKKTPEVTFKISASKKKKRKRTTSESSVKKASLKMKKKNINLGKKYSRLDFDESIDESLHLDECHDEIMSKEQNQLCHSSDNTDSNYVSEDSDIDPLNLQIEDLKLQDIFKPAPSKYLAKCNNLNIPKKHFQISENDVEPDSKIYEESQFENGESNAQSGNIDAQNGNIGETMNSNATNLEGITENQPEVSLIQEDTTANEQITDINPKLDSEQFESEYTTDFIINITLKNNDILLILNINEKIHFYGLCSIEVLQGKIEILGAHLTKTSGFKKVYSPRGSALLYLQNLTCSEENSFRDIRHFIKEELLEEEDRNLSVNDSAGVVLCRKLGEPYIQFIEKHTSQVIFPTSDVEGPRVVFSPQGAWNRIHTDVSWLEAIVDATPTSKIAICGGKGVGKSTILRYYINHLLQKFEKVRVIDLDPGQTEFTIPGCLSIVNVTEELLGPSYTHQLPFQRAFLCNINVGYDINQYLKTVESLIEFLEVHESIPTLFNFCGYHKGLGLEMTMKVINLIKPSKLIQINSSNRSKNYIFDLTVENVKKNVENFNWRLNYEFFQLKSRADNKEIKVWTMEARFSREIQILSYFGKLMTMNVNSLTSSHLIMYSINLSSLKITDSEQNQISPIAINANLVGLCSLTKQNYQYLCHGWGFVRGIDIENDLLVLLTPEPLDTLNLVDHLVLTTNSVVPSLLMDTHEVQGHVPYVSEGTPSNLSQLTKRSYVPPKNKW